MTHNPFPSSWLITGGAGFIGCNLIRRLVAEGVPYIRVLDNLSVGSRDDLKRVCAFNEVDFSSLQIPVVEVGGRTSVDGEKPSEAVIVDGLSHNSSSLIELVVADIRDRAACLYAAKDMEVIVHLAANTGVAPSVENPRLDMETNVIGTLNMLEAARQNRTKRFVFASSGAPVGECEPPIHEELAPHPVSPYGASKLAGEGYCSAYYRTFGVETVCLRFGNVYGPLSSHKSSVIAKFIRQALASEVCEIYGDGNQTRDFIYVDDLFDAILKAAKIPVAGETFQIATNEERTISQVAAMLADRLEHSGNMMKLEYGASRAGDVKRNFSNTAKAMKLLGWTAKTTLDSGLGQTIEWFLRSHVHEVYRPE